MKARCKSNVIRTEWIQHGGTRKIKPKYTTEYSIGNTRWLYFGARARTMANRANRPERFGLACGSRDGLPANDVAMLQLYVWAFPTRVPKLARIYGTQTYSICLCWEPIRWLFIRIQNCIFSKIISLWNSISIRNSII